MRQTLDSYEKDRLRHCVDVAAREFGDHVKMLSAVREGSEMLTTDAAKRLAGEFETYQREAYALLEKIEGSTSIVLADD